MLSFAEIRVNQGKARGAVEELEAELERDEKENLY